MPKARWSGQLGVIIAVAGSAIGLGKYSACTDEQSMTAFLQAYQGIAASRLFSGSVIGYFFFLITLLINVSIIYRGISGGIEPLFILRLQSSARKTVNIRSLLC